MPKHYAIGVNVQGGTSNFDNTKTIKIVFECAFEKKPIIKITPGDIGIFPLYKTSVTTTGFIIRCKTKWTGGVDWEATER